MPRALTLDDDHAQFLLDMAESNMAQGGVILGDPPEEMTLEDKNGVLAEMTAWDVIRKACLAAGVPSRPGTRLPADPPEQP